ncbi:exopolysaccharide biosynthesis polyprenyl glycosylphosphotransferase [Natrialba hulunbeirensis JCM 10989]|uniref:Exopolysaccharide biosynthesis polyprenyl glycosylphosphotransferase n=1 Tax=Natrialba hulunbeirensis JCM 10989 TaxID=1227493 RepID=M0AD31_9EURY|nr:sugar transferase [Natrialba hulunbeirensis]ELY95772.1 exopolysaccharide biosynthesis polyprenyl glycosylphosphotransferase [Natrialba hulunbeirensis JCM 10989]
MLTGWQYRLASVAGVVALTTIALAVANHPTMQLLFTTHIPVFNRLEVIVLSGGAFSWALLLTVLAVIGCLLPLYKPRPRRVLDTIFLTQKRVLVAGFALASLGYFNWSYRLPRATLVMTIGLLTAVLPLWFVWIRRRPTRDPDRLLLVGDDLEQMNGISASISMPILGYLCPSVLSLHRDGEPAADGGLVLQQSGETASADAPFTHLGGLERIGGLSRLETVLLEYDIDTVVLAFRHADRAEFFGALDACHDHGVDVRVHRKYADRVLATDGTIGQLVEVEIEPWDPMDHLFKRVFDVVFALVGLFLAIPLIAAISLAIKLDSPGPVLYSQDRTAGFGETFPVYKFRTMVPEGESAVPSSDTENDRITHVGRFLRKTHLDELPQLWSILRGDMSVVGPRAAWTEEEVLLEEDAPAWRKRWFVKPGLTGLAQVNGAKSTDPQTKLRYDLEYIRRQSFWLDLKLVIRQCWGVVRDLWLTVWR